MIFGLLRLRVALRLLALALALLLLYEGVTFVQVWRASTRDGAEPAGAIVVLGAAQYDGRPSPVFKARLDHAARLYEEGYARIVVVTGGRRPGDRTTEAGAAAAYLASRGVPEQAFRREIGSRNSWESLAATRRILAGEGIDEVLLVSDPYHSYRLAGIADEVGLTAHLSPTPDSPLGGLAELRALAREAAAVSVGRVISYRRLMRAQERVANR